MVAIWHEFEYNTPAPFGERINECSTWREFSKYYECPYESIGWIGPIQVYCSSWWSKSDLNAQVISNEDVNSNITQHRMNISIFIRTRKQGKLKHVLVWHSQTMAQVTYLPIWFDNAETNPLLNLRLFASLPNVQVSTDSQLTKNSPSSNCRLPVLHDALVRPMLLRLITCMIDGGYEVSLHRQCRQVLFMERSGCAIRKEGRRM